MGLGARIEDNFVSIIKFLRRYVNINEEIHFEPFQNGMLMKTLKEKDVYISIIVNKSDSKRDVQIIAPFELKNPMILFSSGSALMTENILSIGSGETAVISWGHSRYRTNCQFSCPVAKQGGWLSIFSSWNSYSAVMIDDHCIFMMSDGVILKNISEFDKKSIKPLTIILNYKKLTHF